MAAGGGLIAPAAKAARSLSMISLRQSASLIIPDATTSWREFCEHPIINVLRLTPLSPAERVVTAYVLQGLSNKEIARALGKSECTVKNQVSSILAKCGAPTRARLMALLRPAIGSSPQQVVALG